MAQIAAARQPERCAGLLLTNAVSYDSWPIPAVASMQRFGRAIELVPDVAMKAFLAMFYRRGHDHVERAREALAVYWPAYERHGAAAAFAHQIRSLHVRDTMAVADQLARLNVLARVVWGAADQFQKMTYGDRLAWDLDATLHRLEGGKHWVPEDHPQAIADALNSLLHEVA